MRPAYRILLTSILILWLLLPGCSGRWVREQILFDFESDSELDQVQWKCHTLFTLSDTHTTHGGFCLKMDLYPSSYPGVSFKLLTGDWSSYDSLGFDLFNPQPTALPLTIRIDDRLDYPDYPDRYNASFSFTPGMNHFVLPLKDLVTAGSRKPLNLRQIHRFLIYMVNPAEGATFYLDYVRLIPTIGAPVASP
jgi:hypothetical protein